MVVIATINLGTSFSMSEQLFLSLVLFNPHCNPVKQEDQFCLGQKIIRKYRERNDMVSNLKALLLDVK